MKYLALGLFAAGVVVGVSAAFAHRLPGEIWWALLGAVIGLGLGIGVGIALALPRW